MQLIRLLPVKYLHESPTSRSTIVIRVMMYCTKLMLLLGMVAAAQGRTPGQAPPAHPQQSPLMLGGSSPKQESLVRVARAPQQTHQYEAELTIEENSMTTSKASIAHCEGSTWWLPLIVLGIIYVRVIIQQS